MNRLVITLFAIICFGSPHLISQNCGNGSPFVTVSVSIAGKASWDNLNDPDNMTMDVCGFPVDGNMVGFSWSDVDLTPLNNSWCSEVAMNLHDVLAFRPAVGESHVAPCTNNYAGGSYSYLQDRDLDFVIDATGCIALEFYETYDDMSNAKDADVTNGHLIFYACPAGFFLPIELNYFSAEAIGEANLIRWETASESNSEWHIIERSFDARDNWEEIDRLPGGGTTTERRKYEVTDASPLSFSYYRLKEMAYDGSIQYSNIAAVKRATLDFEVHSISPNPADENAVLQYEIDKPGEISIQMFDMLGKAILHQSWTSDDGIHQQDIDVANLPAGIYNVVVSFGAETSTTKLIKK